MTEKTKPIRKITRNLKNGKLDMAIWNNTATKKDGTTFQTTSYTIQKSYTTDGKNWKTTESLNKNELQHLYFILLEELSNNTKTEAND